MPAARLLQPLPMPAGEAVLDVLPRLRAALAGSGPALLPHDAGSPPPAELLPGEALAADEDDPGDPTAVVVATSGSTGAAKGALLPAGALRASAAATLARLLPGEPPGGQRWLLALPAHHVAGLQVLLRSLLAGTEPAVVDLSGGFSAAAFVSAAARCTGPRRLTALVPTQLLRLLDAGEEATAALASFDAVLVGAAATPPALLARARDAGVRAVTTYGSSETCGGCVYDGLPLDGVHVSVDPVTSRILLAGAVVARGYRGRASAAFDRDAQGRRRFATDDAGVLSAGPGGGQRLDVLGRLDDIVTTGGLKVAPALVEGVLVQHPGVAEAAVVGVEDAEWGQRLVAAVVPRPGARVDLAELRTFVTARLAAHAAPRQLVLLRELPLRGPGKPDRAALRFLALQATATHPVPPAGPGTMPGG